ncbi:hypothetical protein A6V39_00020 [Candidatus Mycoplasma haematobovis]|uniref:Uncharacterized protein n=1 Tax=Candidatus Mycoplasma haematobovis TaxID=432608 RepID=A0A1A9QE82_9MOLU|nr:hypothetical protein [Candidatus Mycoplasma haematobovis]OAL10434.1 hypothetical protein A6V39_00020 [Candidatus Mycoplasma haematobovis]
MNPKYLALVGGGVTTIIGSSFGAYYLSQDKTIGDKLKKLNSNLIETVDEYEVAFKENKSTKEFTNLISLDNEKITSDSTLVAGGKALKAWCEKQYKKGLSKGNIEELITKVTNYCSEPPVDISAKLKKQGKSLAGEWSSQLVAVKQKTDDTLLGELQKINRGIKTMNDENQAPVIEALEKWCNDNVKTKLTDDKQDTTWNKVVPRCIEDATT